MESVIIILLSSIIILLGLILTLTNIIRNKTLLLIDWAIISFVLLYGVGFPLVYLSTIAGVNPSHFSYHISQFSSVEIVYYFILTVCLIVFTKLGWHLKTKRAIKLTIKNKDIYNLDERIIKKHIKFAWLMLIISFVSYYLYSMAFGGFSGLLAHTIAIRSGTFSITNKFSFLEKFGQFSIVCTYVFYALIIDKNINKKSKKGAFLGFVSALFFSLFFIYSRGGRGSLMFFLLTMILITAYCNSEKISKFFKKIARKLILLPVAFVAMDRLWSRTGESSIFSLLVASISYPFAAFIVNFQNGTYRLFKDFIQAPFYFLPSSIWASKLNFTTSNAETTFLIFGGYKGENFGGRIVTSTTPNDLLTFAYMQANILGVVVIGLLLGLFLKYFHNKIFNEKYDGIKYMFYSYFIVRFTITLTLYGDLVNIIITNWGFIVYFAVFSIYKRFRVVRN